MKFPTEWKVIKFHGSSHHQPASISTANTAIWVNYNISQTWIKAILGWFPLLTMIPVRENSEVVIIYPDKSRCSLEARGGAVPWGPSSSRTWRRSHWSSPGVSTKSMGSMYGIYVNIGGILMVNVTIYSIHGSYGKHGKALVMTCSAFTRFFWDVVRISWNISGTFWNLYESLGARRLLR